MNLNRLSNFTVYILTSLLQFITSKVTILEPVTAPIFYHCYLTFSESLRSDFLNFSTMPNNSLFLWGCFPELYRMFNSIPGLYPLLINSTTPSCDDQKCPHIFPNIPWEQSQPWLRTIFLDDAIYIAAKRETEI